MAAAPFVGAWIEIHLGKILPLRPSLPHPSWVRGLKYRGEYHKAGRRGAAPFVGAWIEIMIIYGDDYDESDAAPFVGAWIEMNTSAVCTLVTRCRTLRGCVD